MGPRSGGRRRSGLARGAWRRASAGDLTARHRRRWCTRNKMLRPPGGVGRAGASAPPNETRSVPPASERGWRQRGSTGRANLFS